jgi:hypothetical protein
MSIITIPCRLVSREFSRYCLWKLMADQNTPLISELLALVGNHTEFEAWQQQGKLPAKLVKNLCDSLDSDPRFEGQPSRFYSWAVATVNYIYKSLFAIQQKLRRDLERKSYWLSRLESASSFIQTNKLSWSDLYRKAEKILATAIAQDSTDEAQQRNGKKKKKDKIPRKLATILFGFYNQTEDPAERCAITCLIANACCLRKPEEDLPDFTELRREKEIEIERIQEKLKTSRLPQGRDLTGKDWLEALELATFHQLDDEQHEAVQANLLRESSSLPFPVSYESTQDFTWSRNDKGRICVKLNGLAKHHTFEVYCDRRHLHWFERFLKDQETKHNSEDKLSSSLYTLRSGQLIWKEGEVSKSSSLAPSLFKWLFYYGFQILRSLPEVSLWQYRELKLGLLAYLLLKNRKREPWNVHHLHLHCAVETLLWTAEGTQQVANEKAARTDKTISKMEEKEKKGELNEAQQASLIRTRSMREGLNNPFPRPSQPLYQGQSNLVVGVSMGLDKPATVAVVDVKTGKVLTYRNVKQLLGKNYKLLNQQRQRQDRDARRRHEAQKKDAPNQFGASKLGQYVDRLLAKAIVAIALTYKASSIALPKLGEVRERVNSQIQARAEKECLGHKKSYQKYGKQYRTRIHSWSYGRLIENIQQAAAEVGIAIVEGQQPSQGTPQEKAGNVALSAYQNRMRAVS